MKLHLFLVLKMNRDKKIVRGGWSGFGTETVGIDPNTFEVFNGHPNKIPTDEILGGVVQNCLKTLMMITRTQPSLPFDDYEYDE